MLNVNKIREDFYMYKEHEGMVYLDSAATSLTPDVVVDEMSKYYKTYRATVHRSMYTNGVKADTKYNDTRRSVANFINAKETEVIYTRSTTSGMNALARAIVEKLDKNAEILISEIEHHSTLLPWRETAKKHNIKTKYIPLDGSKITLDKIKEVVTENTEVIAINHVSNVLGDKVAVEEIGEFCNTNDIILVLDAAQSITHEKIDVQKIKCDFLVFSAHKMLGPTGLGILYGKEEKLQELIFEYGGDMAHLVTKDELTTKELPIGLEAGTPSIAQVISFGKAIEYLEKIGMEAIHEHVMELKEYAISKLQEIPEVEIFNPDSESGLITFNIKNIPAHDALQEYSLLNIAIRGGHMCNQLTLKHLNQNSVLRASIYIYNDKKDIDKFIARTKIAIKNLEWML